MQGLDIMVRKIYAGLFNSGNKCEKDVIRREFFKIYNAIKEQSTLVND